jgi:dihydrofolate reductase
MKYTAIVAMTPDRILGRDGGLPWHLPEDLKFFKRTTINHPVIMGRKTFESIGRPLPKRQNIVITRDETWSAEGVTVVHSPDDLAALDLQDPRIFIIGGAQIYQTFLPLLDDILVSRVYEVHEGDTRFPEFEAQFPNFEILEQHDAFEIRRYHR